MFELRHLRYFVQAAQLEHMGRAAAALHISQSALSHQVIQLEQVLGIALFDRVGRTVHLTPAGRHFKAYAQHILKSVEDARNSMYEIGALNAGELHIGAFHTFAASLLPRAVARFHHLHPNVRIVVLEGHADRIESAVADSEVDFGVGFAPLSRASLRSDPLFEDKLALVVPPSHRLFGRRRIRLRDLDAVPLALLTSRFSMRRLLDGAIAGVLRLDVRLEMESVQALLRTIADCTEIATVLPHRAVSAESGLGVISIVEPSISRLAALLWHKDRIPSPAAVAFANEIRNQADKQC